MTESYRARIFPNPYQKWFIAVCPCDPGFGRLPPPPSRGQVCFASRNDKTRRFLLDGVGGVWYLLNQCSRIVIRKRAVANHDERSTNHATQGRREQPSRIHAEPLARGRGGHCVKQSQFRSFWAENGGSGWKTKPIRAPGRFGRPGPTAPPSASSRLPLPPRVENWLCETKPISMRAKWQ